MAKNKKYLWIIVLLAILPGFFTLYAEDENPVKFNFNLAIGLDNFMEGGSPVSYQKISFSPDLAVGNFGIGIDVTIHYRFEAGSIIPRVEGDWTPVAAEQGNFQAWLSLYLSKFKYIRYGVKNDPLFIKLGSIDDALIGNGFIMANYSNTMFLPEQRIFGLNLDVDGKLFDFPLIGIETFINNIALPEVYGARLFFRPLIFSDIPIINEMEVGIPLVADTKPYFDAATLAPVPADGAAAVFTGLDVNQPLIANPAVTMAAFGDLATYKFKSYGGMIGAGGTLITLFNYGAQLRFIGNGFIPFYFDATYDLVKEAKYKLAEAGNTQGYVGWFGLLGTNLLDGAVVFNMSIEGPFGTVDNNPDNFLNYPRIKGILQIKEDLLPLVSGELTYDKIFIRDISDVFPNFFQDAVIMARVNFKTGPAVISLFYRIKYVEGTWNMEAVSGLETMIQF
ncbi:MAG: hypothetical protein JW969_14295 [Spirochaetales bacterium]|nr:hypothetical protein [Spirochaetales bacterium]